MEEKILNGKKHGMRVLVLDVLLLLVCLSILYISFCSFVSRTSEQ